MPAPSIECPRCGSARTQALQCADGTMLAIICDECSACVLSPAETAAATHSPDLPMSLPGGREVMETPPQIYAQDPGNSAGSAPADIVAAAEDEALDFCIANVLATVSDGYYRGAVEQILAGEGYRGAEGWELCLWSRRSLGVDVASGFNQTAILAWTDPARYGFQPHFQIYDESEFRRFMAVRVIRRIDAEGGIRIRKDALSNSAIADPDTEIH